MSTFKFNWKNFQSIVLAGRRGFTKEMAAIGKTIMVTIQGNGNTIDVKNKEGDVVASATGTGEVLQKRIFNTYANSGVAMNNPQNIAKLKEAKAAEKAGEFDKAHTLFNELANSLQVSFAVLYGGKGDAIIAKLGDNVEISAKLLLVTTDKGSIITLEPKTIRVMEPEVVGAMTLPSAWAGDDEEEVDAEDAFAAEDDEFSTMDRPALVAKAKELGLKTKDKSDDVVRDEIRAKVAEAALAEEEA